METKRTTLATVVVALALALFAQPAAAYSSTTESLIRGLNEQLLFVAVPITLLVEGILIYTVLKYRNAEEAQPTKENRRLEITWTVATAVILLFVGVAAYGVMGNPAVTYQQGVDDAPTQDDVVVDVTAYRYAWDFTYQTEDGNFTTTNELVIPADKDVYFDITSRDWLHSFHVPELGLKQDAIPHQHNTIKTTPTETGTYQGYCAEYCGQGHSGMLFTVKVVSQEEYQAFLEENAPSGNSANSSN